MTNISIVLPEVTQDTSNYLSKITGSLNISRDIVASDSEIKYAWDTLPRVLSKIPLEMRTKGVAKMCIAVSCGLFDSGINYIWNEAIYVLRNKVKVFGLGIVGEIIGRKDFDEGKLLDLKDSELITLSLKLNIITEEGFLYLDQCRDMRNHFSAAHPPVGELDEHELISFTNRCIKYALSNEVSLVGINISEFILSLKSGKYDEEQINAWEEKLGLTHEAQRELLFGMLYSIYCDPDSNEETRVNALNIFRRCEMHVTPTVKSNLLNFHQEYIIKGKKNSSFASNQFFEKTGNLELLGDSEIHNVIFKACKNLMDAHNGMQNFYNEPPFAERLYELSSLGGIPNSVKDTFVEVVLICGMGNGYGVSNGARKFYRDMVSNFSPKEIVIMFNMIEDKSTYAGKRISYGLSYQNSFRTLISGIDISSVPVDSRVIFKKWSDVS